MVWPKGAIQQWYATQDRIDLVQAAAKGADMQRGKQHDTYRQRLSDEIGPLQQKEGRFVMEQYDGSPQQAILHKNIFSREAFDRIANDGNSNKPLGELLKLYPSAKAKRAAAAK